MAKRPPRKQSAHDKKVRQIANKFSREGWDVKADVPGFGSPDPIGTRKRIPDVVAKKRGATRIIEVETRETVDKDRAQQSTFRRSAARRPRTSFDTVVTND